MGFKSNISVGDLNKARHMRELGSSWRAIAAAIGTSPQTVRRRIDPDFDLKERKRNQRISRGRSLNPQPLSYVKPERVPYEPGLPEIKWLKDDRAVKGEPVDV